MGIPEYEAKRYEGRVKNGGILLSVHSDDSEWTGRAKKLLEETGAEDIASASEAKADLNKTDKPMPRGETTEVRRGLDEVDERAREHMVAKENAGSDLLDTTRPLSDTPSTYRKDH